jgi:hypothetical protein
LPPSYATNARQRPDLRTVGAETGNGSGLFVRRLLPTVK